MLKIFLKIKNIFLIKNILKNHPTKLKQHFNARGNTFFLSLPSG
jgi:hypothetical protein